MNVKIDVNSLAKFDTNDICSWFTNELNLNEYVPIIQKKKINGRMLILFEEKHLKDLKIKIGHRKLIMKYLKRIRNEFNEDTSSEQMKKEKLSPKKHPSFVLSWTCDDVANWLDEIGFGEFKGRFIEESITGEVLCFLNEGILADLGMKSLGQAKKFIIHLENVGDRVDTEFQKPTLKKKLSGIFENLSKSNNNLQIEKNTITESNPRKWNVNQVCQWISNLGFKQYMETFNKNQISGEELLSLNENDLSHSLYINLVGPRKKIYRSIQTLKNQI